MAPPRRGHRSKNYKRLAIAVVVTQVGADVVERAVRRTEARVDLIQLRGIERRPEALQALTVVQPQLGRQIVTLQQTDVVDPRGSGSAGSISIVR